VTVEIKQIIPLGTPGTYVEISAPLDINLSNYELRPKILENEVENDLNFAIPIQIKNKNEGFYNTRIKIIYNTKYIEILYPYKDDGTPSEKITNDTYSFDKEFTPSSTNIIYLVGKSKNLENEELIEYVGIRYKIKILTEDGKIIKEIEDYIKIKNN